MIARTYKIPGIFKFTIVGGVSTIMNLGILYYFTDVVGIHYLISNILAFIISVSFTYASNSYWTFATKKASWFGFWKYVFANIASVGIGEGLLYLFTDVFGMWYLIASVVTIPITFVFNFGASKYIVWNKSK